MHVVPALTGRMVAALVDLSRPGHFVSWGFIQISVANLILICLMAVVFLAAILVPYRSHRSRDEK